MHVTLYRGDCLEKMSNIADGSVDLILCDLPYGTTACKWDVVIPFEPLWAHYWRVLKRHGVVVLFGSQPFTSRVVCSQIHHFVEQIIWKKHKPSNIAALKTRVGKYHEEIVVFSLGKHTFHPQPMERISRRFADAQRTGWKGRNTGSEVSGFSKTYEIDFDKYDANSKNPSSILEGFFLANNSKEKVPHPTQKPVSLLEYLIKTYTNEGETVLDNCMGSGSTGVACVNTNRNFIGIEKDDNYFEIAINRIKAECDTSKEVLWEGEKS